MKQVLIRGGRAVVEEMPAPTCGEHEVLVQAAFSMISAGTETVTVQDSAAGLGASSWSHRLRKVGEVARMVRDRGLRDARIAVRARLEGPSRVTGYSLSGTVLEVGTHVRDLAPGQRVACAGADSAHHAEIVAVPRNLVVPVPVDLPLDLAASVTLGAIALQGVRQADPRLGEVVCVLGLGMIGQLSAALFRAAGCRVVGSDIDPQRVERARELGLELAIDASRDELEAQVSDLTGGKGADAAILTAASDSSELTRQAVRLIRRRGRVVVVGAVGMHLDRTPFYMKEAELRISCSYGPGRYDPSYEEQGNDYPFGYVRWTENRNMAEFLRMASVGAVPLADLIDRTFEVDRAHEAYALFADKTAVGKPLGVLLRYPQAPVETPRPSTPVAVVPRERTGQGLGVACVGPGNFARQVHLPNLTRLAPAATLRAVVGRSANAARETARRFAAETASTELDDVLRDESVDLVLICTRHDLHAEQASRALRAGKAVFLEKPAALDSTGLENLRAAVVESGLPFTLGLNRRFAPDVLALRALLQDRRGPLLASYRVNAARLPADHWTLGPQGGGRLIGEACHMIDLLGFLVGQRRAEHALMTLAPTANGDLSLGDNFSLSCRYADGSVTSLSYTSVGHGGSGKERLECHWDGRTMILDDFRRSELHGGGGADLERAEPDKGHAGLLQAFVEHAAGRAPAPIPWDEILDVSRFVLLLDRQARESRPRIGTTEAWTTSTACRESADGETLRLAASRGADRSTGSTVNRLQRYWTLWRSLPVDERRERTGRVVERWFRRSPSMRRVGVIPDQPRWGEFRRALRVDPEQLFGALRRHDPRRGPLFANLEQREVFLRSSHPEHVEALGHAAERILEGRFDLLGSGPSELKGRDGRLDWHRDWKSGGRWPADVHHTELVVVRGDGSDVKLPWELARFQHLLVLAQAVRLLPRHPDPACAEEFRRRCSVELRGQIDDWIERNPRGLGIHWSCTMEVAIRSFVWLACLGLLRQAPEFDDAFLARLVRSLWVHGRHIRRNLEIGADGATSNHYLSNVIGLYAIACGLPELREARAWRLLARRALIDEMNKQVHPDGADFERSIPYHRLVTEIFLHGQLLASAAGDELGVDYRRRLLRMLEFVAGYTRPDGSAPQWGDNDDGRLLPLDGYAAPQPHDHRHLLALGGRMFDRDDLSSAGRGREIEACWLLESTRTNVVPATASHSSRAFEHSGCYIMRGGDLHAFVPCAPVGSAGLGSHSHNDLLSLIVWAGGVEWITDPGSGCYTGDPESRNRLRSTAAHATLQLGEREQNPFGSGLDELFRMGDRARPQVESWTADPQGARLVSNHGGFSLPGDAWVHRRSVRFDAPGRRWHVLDELWQVEGPQPVEDAFLRFPLSPGTRGREVDDLRAYPAALRGSLNEPGVGREWRAVRLLQADLEFWVVLGLPAGSRVDVVTTRYSPRYGVTVKSECVTARLPAAARTEATTVLWSPPAELAR